MTDISTVIIVKNAAATIGRVIESALLVSEDVIILDSGSTDQTLEIAASTKARIVKTDWLGYGETRNKGAAYAKYDFILNIDADEVISNELAQNINELQLALNTIYGFKRHNYLGNKLIRHGEWSGDIVYRIYNRNETCWNTDTVHEKLLHSGQEKKIIQGALLHYTSKDINSYKEKLNKYAVLSTGKNNKKLYKKWLSPSFNFFKNYIFKLGFLDGKEGFQIAKAHFNYTKKKYH